MVITDWTTRKAHAFGRENLAFRHQLHERPMFSDTGLADTLDRYPRDRLGVFTMGDDPVAWRTWRRGGAGDLTGAQLLDAVQSGRIWLNLRAVNQHLPAYQAVCDEIFADKEANAPGLKTLKQDVGLLISSPEVQVFYHLDVPLVSLWQLRGQKRVWVYPPEAPYAPDDRIEAVVLKERAEQMPYDRDWDAAADVFDLEPGAMVTWRQNAPHRIENGPMMNVSLSVEFMTPRALLRANAVYGAGVLRRRLGVNSRTGDRFGPAAAAKVAVARVAKALDLHKASQATLPLTFQLARADGGVALNPI